MLLTDRQTGQVGSHDCSHSWDITSQNGGEFSGRFKTEGNGPSSDRFCSQTGTMMGVIRPDGTLVTLRFDPELRSTACTKVSGDGIFRGTLTTGTKLRLAAENSDQLTCDAILGEQTAGERDRTTRISTSLEFPA